MTRETVVVGLDGIVWRGDGLLTDTYNNMIHHGMIGREFNHNKRDSRTITRAVGKAITGRTVEEMRPLAQEVSRSSVTRVDRNVIKKLWEFSPKTYQLIAMSSAPDFVVELALEGLRLDTGLAFDTSTVLSSTFETEDDHYTGNYVRLNKTSAAANLVQESGGRAIKVGVINGISDIVWSRDYCDETMPINPGPALLRYLAETANQLEAVTS